jgi:hypothetical protein
MSDHDLDKLFKYSLRAYFEANEREERENGYWGLAIMAAYVVFAAIPIIVWVMK